MAVHLRILLILTGLKGIYNITTVSEVSVKAGDSITIPCLYDSKYRSHVKYLCEGYLWHECSYAVKTNQPHNSGKFSISDDKTSIFTVTIKDLTDADAHYWCAVEIGGGADVRQYFHLSVTTGLPSLYVDHQEIIGFDGDSVTISCYYRNSGPTKWCRLGGKCVVALWGTIDGTRVTISAKVPSVFTVTMSGLATESSGWYLCVKGDLQMPVHLTVTEKPTTSTLAAMSFLTTLSPTDPGHSSLQNRASLDLKSLIIPLSLLISIVMLALLTWLLLKKCKQSNADSSAMTTDEEEVTYSNVKQKRIISHQADETETYCNVGYMGKTSGQRSRVESDVDMMYSSVVTIKPRAGKRVEAQDTDVTYSMLARPH